MATELSPNEPMSFTLSCQTLIMLYKPHRDIDPIFRSTTPIDYQEEQGGGTGFFINHSGQTYIVTNRHVVDPDGVSPQRARIWIRESSDIFNRTAIDLDLEASSSSSWKYHPNRTEIDIAVTSVEPCLSTIGESDDEDRQTGSLAFSTDHFVHENIEFDSRVAVLAHPDSIFDADSHFPIRRNALIASPYGATFGEKPIFLTDARMHDGMSGGPVIVDSGWYGGSNVPPHRFRNYLLIGIHSETYFDPSPDDRSFEEARFDLNAAWYPRTIRDILDGDIDD